MQIRSIIVIGLFLTLGGCAYTVESITEANIQTITLLTPELEGVSCKLTDVRGNSWYVPETPDTVTVKKGNAPLSIMCSHPGYKPHVTLLRQHAISFTLPNIMAETVDILVDPFSGIAGEYPNPVYIVMEPHYYASEEEEAEWKREKNYYEELMNKQLNGGIRPTTRKPIRKYPSNFPKSVHENTRHNIFN